MSLCAGGLSRNAELLIYLGLCVGPLAWAAACRPPGRSGRPPSRRRTRRRRPAAGSGAGGGKPHTRRLTVAPSSCCCRCCLHQPTCLSPRLKVWMRKHRYTWRRCGGMRRHCPCRCCLGTIVVIATPVATTPLRATTLVGLICMGCRDQPLITMDTMPGG